MMLKRTTSDDPDFQLLVAELEEDLKIRDGDDYWFYAQLNKIAILKHVVVAYTKDGPIACGAFRNYTEDTVEIKRMYVRAADRVHGVATTLLSELEKWCMELGFKNCVLETGKNQPEAIAFYKKNYYELISNFDRYKGSGNSICFKKTLKA